MPPKRKRVAPTLNALPDALIRRFADDVVRLTGQCAADRIGVAISGGSDSTALLLLAAAAFPGRVEAATVDHRLRPQSASEAGHVAELCAALGIAHATLTLDVLPDGNVSAKAREARYTALGHWCDRHAIAWLMTGHHADDQCETMVMRLNRGAGVAGLSGIRARQGRIIRPLLNWRRQELVALVAHAGIRTIDDPTNRDDAYDRARLRKSLHAADWIDASAFALSAQALAEADTALDWMADRVEAAYVRHDEAGVSFDRRNADVPAEILRRLILRCLRRIDPDCDPRGVQLARLVAMLEQDRSATLGKVVARGGDFWYFRAAPPRRATFSQ